MKVTTFDLPSPPSRVVASVVLDKHVKPFEDGCYRFWAVQRIYADGLVADEEKESWQICFPPILVNLANGVTAVTCADGLAAYLQRTGQQQ